MYTNKKRIGAVILTMAMVTVSPMVPVIPTGISAAAGKPKLESGKGTYLTGESQTVKIKNIKEKKIKKLAVYSSKKSVATVKASGKKAFVVKSKKAGKAMIHATVTLKNNKNYKLKYAATVADTVDRKVPVHYLENADSSVSLRFFSETPHVPYIRLSTFYHTFTGDKEMKIQKTAENEYLLTNPKGDTATVNTETDVLNSDRYNTFTTVVTEEEDKLSENTDAVAPFLNSPPEVIIEPAKPISLSFSNYGMDIKGDADDIWLPFETAANLFVSYYGTAMYYNGTSIFRCSSMDDEEYLYGDQWLDEYNSLYPDGVRPADLADYSYRELMLLLDFKWGNPGRCYFADSIREKGMDRALSETDDSTRGVQALLKSTNLADYMFGLGILNDMLFDGGHTDFIYITDPYMALTGASPETYSKEFFTDMKAAADKIGYKLKSLPSNYWSTLHAIEKSRGWTGYSYHEQGDTAVYTFNIFEADPVAWAEYYKNGGELPNDTFGCFIKYLNKAAESGTIKNFVLDITTNYGGESSIVCAMLNIMGYSPDSYYKDSITGRMYKLPLEVDKNLDGKFDKADDAVKYPFHFAILTSRVSFSSGNLLPYWAKEYGVMTLGETSGGGGFAETTTSSPDGLVWYYSGSMMASDQAGSCADQSVVPDIAIEAKTDAEGKPDYSAFYDIPALSGYINKYYATKRV